MPRRWKCLTVLVMFRAALGSVLRPLGAPLPSYRIAINWGEGESLVREVRYLPQGPIGAVLGSMGANSTLSSTGASPPAFTIMSWNSLAQSLAQSRFFPYAAKGCLRKRPRQPLLHQEVFRYSADIICLQEMDLFSDLMQEARKHQYDGVYKSKTVPAERQPLGQAVLFNTKRFRLKESGCVEYGEDLMHGVALMALLEQVGGSGSAPRRVAVANTHLYWNPNREDIKAGQVKLLLEKLEEFLRRTCGDGWRECPLVVTGDLNTSPGGVTYKTLQQQASLPELRSAYASYGELFPSQADATGGMTTLGEGLQLGPRDDAESQGEPLFTTATAKFVSTLDYIFHSKSSLKLKALLSLPSGASLAANPLLAATWPHAFPSVS
ncbi:unnamed protein product [Chrysoparadoxa australica]